MPRELTFVSAHVHCIQYVHPLCVFFEVNLWVMWNGLSQERELFQSSSHRPAQRVASGHNRPQLYMVTTYANLYTSLPAAVHILTSAFVWKCLCVHAGNCLCPDHEFVFCWGLLSQFAVLGSWASVSMATCWVFWIARIPSSPHPSLCVAAIRLPCFWRACLLDKFSYNSTFESVYNNIAITH